MKWDSLRLQSYKMLYSYILHLQKTFNELTLKIFCFILYCSDLENTTKLEMNIFII